MTYNRFADCNTPEEVLWVWRKLTDGTSAVVAIPDALARIRELTPPRKPVVSEKSRERALSAVLSAMREARNAGPDTPTANWWLYRIIDALGYTEATYGVVIREPARSVSVEELIAVLGAHIYGDRGPFTDHPHRFSVCTRAAEDLAVRYQVLRIGGEQ